jgi:UDP-N-acetyl-D-glucosamine dehydrogenase
MDLARKIADRSSLIGVIGLGYVGLPLALAFAEAGFQVQGIDTDGERAAKLEAGSSYVPDVDQARLVKAVRTGKFGATTSYQVLEGLDVVCICVPTPLSKTRDPDISSIIAATQGVAEHLGSGMLVVLESTTYPGTTEEVVLPQLAAGELLVGEDFYLAYSPERIDPGNRIYSLKDIPKVVAGVTVECLSLAVALYGTIVEEVIPVSSPRTAEMVKMLENTFRAVNIGLVNEAAIICRRLGIDIWEVVEAASTKPFGFMPFYPGPGLGGHCLPVDPQFLAWKLRALNYNARFVELATEVNAHMPEFVASLVADSLNQEGKALKGSKILVLGIGYKRDSGDVRESPALEIMRLLGDKGAIVRYYDPYVEASALDESYERLEELSEETLAGADCAVIVADHSLYDWQWIAAHARLIVDTRNATRDVRGTRARIVKL